MVSEQLCCTETWSQNPSKQLPWASATLWGSAAPRRQRKLDYVNTKGFSGVLCDTGQEGPGRRGHWLLVRVLASDLQH